MQGQKEIRKWDVGDDGGSIIARELEQDGYTVFLVDLRTKPKGEGTYENAFNEEFVMVLNELFDWIENHETNGSPRVMITFSTGKIYSTGLDLDWLMSQEIGGEKQMQFMDSFHKLLARLLTFPIPTIAVLNGHAFAGGFLFAIAHDYRVMNMEKGFACMNEIEIGAPLTPPLNALLKEKIPRNLAADMMLQGARLNSSTLLKNQVLHAQGQSNDLLTIALQLSKLVQKNSASPAMRSIKEDLYRDAFLMLRDGPAFRSSL